MKSLLILCFIVCSFSNTNAQDNIFGQWMTIDDNSNKPKSIIEIYEKEGMAFGKIIKLFREPEEDPDPLCDECEGTRYNQRIIGMEILSKMKKSDDSWEGGEILDPENGNIYRCKIWIEDGKLKVRGYVMFLYRTQTWIKEE